MQPRGRRRDRAFLAREHGLVVGAVLLVDVAAAGDIGRQRHVAAFGQRLVEHRAGEGKGERHLAALVALPFLLDRGVELFEKADPPFAAEAHDVADREPLRRLDQSAPARAVEPLDQGRRDGRLVLAAAEPPAVQIGGKDLGVVDDNGVAAAATAPADRA